jgi:hypothetical protein
MFKVFFAQDAEKSVKHRKIRSPVNLVNHQHHPIVRSFTQLGDAITQFHIGKTRFKRFFPNSRKPRMRLLQAFEHFAPHAFRKYVK